MAAVAGVDQCCPSVHPFVHLIVCMCLLFVVCCQILCKTHALIRVNEVSVELINEAAFARCFVKSLYQFSRPRVTSDVFLHEEVCESHCRDDTTHDNSNDNNST